VPVLLTTMKLDLPVQYVIINVETVLDLLLDVRLVLILIDLVLIVCVIILFIILELILFVKRVSILV